MSNIGAVLFPGQGILRTGWNIAAHCSNPVIMETINEASEILQMDIANILPQSSWIRDTSLAQPLIHTISVAFWRSHQTLFGSTLHPEYYAGHSLGEYSAFVASGSLPFRQTLAYLRIRGIYMRAVFGALPSWSVKHLTFPSEQKMKAFSESNRISIRNTNKDCIITGQVDDLCYSISEAKVNEAEVREFDLSCPFHSDLMQVCERYLYRDTDEISRHINPSSLKKLVSNITGRQMCFDSRYFLNHMIKPVEWKQSIDTILQNIGDKSVLCIGPGNGIEKLLEKGWPHTKSRLLRSEDLV